MSSTGGARQESPCRLFLYRIHGCSWTFKLCPFLSCLSSHSPQLTQDCQTDKFSPVHSEFLSWPTLWAWRVLQVCLHPAFALSSQNSKPPALVIFLTLELYFLCFRAMCYSVIVSQALFVFIDVSPFFVSPHLFLPSSSCHSHLLHPWERFRQNRTLLLSSLFRSSPSS